MCADKNCKIKQRGNFFEFFTIKHETCIYCSSDTTNFFYENKNQYP